MNNRNTSTKVFGQSMRRGNSNNNTRYQRQVGINSKNKNGDNSTISEEQELMLKRLEMKKRQKNQEESFDEKFGFTRYSRASTNFVAGESRRGWVFNILATTVTESGSERSGIDLYFLSADGSTFKATVLHNPYFYIIASPPRSTTNTPLYQAKNNEDEEDSMYYENITSTLLRKYESHGLRAVELVRKQDLDALNHLGLAGSKGRLMFKLVFDTVQQLMDVRKEIKPIIDNNVEVSAKKNVFYMGGGSNQNENLDPLSSLIDIREYDVPYIVRVCIDLNIRGGAWYTVTPNVNDSGVTLSDQDVETKANPSFLAFDIECTKAPLKFPDANVDSIFMISYMIEGQGYLIISRHVVGADVENFEYTPKPSYPGPFIIFNELTEEDLIKRFFSEFQKFKPQIVVTYNGDFFDWPFLEQRAALYGLDIKYELGFERISDGSGDGEYRGRCSVHMDAFSWVKRDSYLPQGAQGLKAVTKYKLGYDPVEVDPEDMVRFARDRPTYMASYSVSDAVATYYLYEKYVHLYIFSLCTIIPMGPEDVLRKGSGTLCEVLLMVQACNKDIICPNKQVDPLAKFHQGHLLESETYIGGKVECLETGVYRSDIEYKFDLIPSAFQGLIDNVDRDLTFAIEVEGDLDRNKVTNYDEIRCQIIEKLEMLRDRPNRFEKPYVYHLDVGAMYPNIILTNRLQPSAMVDDSTCAACDFNQAKNNCKRKMNWVWRGDYNPATKSDYDRTKDQLSREKLSDGRHFHDLTQKEQETLVANRLKLYSRNAYKKTKVTTEITRSDIVCMRENDFYVDTVRQFRDRRYDYKILTKKWGGKVRGAKDAAARKEAEDRVLVYDSLQVAHKCILNSFYGYVMRKGARWRSMEMAGIVTKTGADLIVQARKLVEQIGRPLELDTDGIWCILPQSFPEVYTFKLSDGSKFILNYPCVMLNADVHENFTNHQYQTLVNREKGVYETRSECSIFFEVDGPYRCMVLPASTDEGRLLKKRYAVFNFNGSLAELKGFELKRRGELELIKTFQSQVFERFLNGNSLVECYDSVADVANHWIDVIDTCGENLDTDELVDLISENRSMSRQLEDYGDQKGTSQTTARRLGEFLGSEIIKDKGLNCKFVISELPHGAPVTERAVPTAIWKAESAIMKHYLRKWLKNPGMEGDDFDIRNILDWDYYRDRLGKTIQKIITIPAALQGISNPVPRITHPEWLQKTVKKMNDRFQQQSITNMFSVVSKKGNVVTPQPKEIKDIEDIGGGNAGPGRPIVHSSKRNLRNQGQANVNVVPLIDTSLPDQVDKVVLSKETFQEWLLKKKSVWRFRNKKRALNQLNSNKNQYDTSTGDLSNKKQKKSLGSLEGYIRDAAIAVMENEWQIVEVREASTSHDSISNFPRSGHFVLWVLLSNGSLQKIQLNVPRTFYLNCREEINESSGPTLNVKRVDKYLPHNKSQTFIYEVTLSEELFWQNNWLQNLCSSKDAVESFYELNTPLILRVLLNCGSICRPNPNIQSKSNRFSLSDLRMLRHPSNGLYLNNNLAYKRLFFYENVNSNSKRGLVALFVMGGTNGEKNDDGSVVDFSNPQLCSTGSFGLSSVCHVWVVKRGANEGQKNLSKRNCELMFSQLLTELQNDVSDDDEYEYACISPDSRCSMKTLAFHEDENEAFSGVQEVLNSYTQGNNGPTFLIVNSFKSTSQIRKLIPGCNSFPLITLPPLPGVSPNSLPALGWEPQAFQGSLEAYLYMGAVSFPKRVNWARYAKIPIGNLGSDEIATTYDVTFARSLQQSRAILWANEKQSYPDLGYSSLPIVPGSTITGVADGFGTGGKFFDSNDLWGDDDEHSSPIVCYPGTYRCVCVDIDIHGLAIAALTDTSQLQGAALSLMGKQSDATNVPLGDDMSTAVSLPILRSLATSWLKDAIESKEFISDQLLGSLYRIISTPSTLLYDPALSRVLLSMMRSSFYHLIGEFQRLGSTIIFANFNRIVVATNKVTLSEAKEYIEFIVSTMQKGFSSQDSEYSNGLSRLSLNPSKFYSDYIFLDQHNFGAIQFETRDPEDDDEQDWAFPLEIRNEDASISSIMIVPKVISGWNIMRHLSTEISQEYFRAIIGRFSKDIYRKRVILQNNESEGKDEELIVYKKKVVGKHFSSYLTRAVAEILKDGDEVETNRQILTSTNQLAPPALQFVKSILVVLELDSEIESEVLSLKKSLLTQLGIQEYSEEAKWINPSASFILGNVFCSQCNETRDVDLCVVTPEEESSVDWVCDECNTPYHKEYIERRLVDIVERKCLRYQLQDLRCVKTNYVAKRVLSRQSVGSGSLKGDISREDFASQILILHKLAKIHSLELLQQTTTTVLKTY